jgi:hypothetical protein
MFPRWLSMRSEHGIGHPDGTSSSELLPFQVIKPCETLDEEDGVKQTRRQREGKTRR